ncbi:hypothetical protein [Bacillus sp. JJ1764]|uniref:hypothetical protein n=1 Tax=Bacillus sp. JJ1764 TaxID=3122964 RepID=UPI003000CE18
MNDRWKGILFVNVFHKRDEGQMERNSVWNVFHEVMKERTVKQTVEDIIYT